MILRKSERRLNNYLAIAIAVSTWGTWPLWLRASPLDGQAKAFWALAFIAALGMVACALPALRRAWPTRRDWLYLLLMGACAAVNQTAYFAALQYTSVARAALSHYVAPVLVALLAPWLLRERFDPRVPVAMAAALGGLALLLSDGTGAAEAAESAGSGTNDVVGVALGLTSAFFYAALFFCAKRIEAPLSPMLLVTAHFGIAALLALPYLLVAGVPLLAPPQELAFIGLAALVAGLVPAAVFYRALLRVPAQHAAVLTYLEPVVSAVLAWVVFGEALGWRGVTGAGVVLGAGLFVVMRR